MKNKLFFSFCLAITISALAPLKTQAQGFAINPTGAPADTSAMLDVAATNKGILIPRMTTAQRNAIPLPATGLMVYQTDSTAGFYYYNGAVWFQIGANGSNAWSINGNNIYSAFGSNYAGGTYSLAGGENSYANGAACFAMGSNDSAKGDYSTAMGQSTVASGNTSTSMGKYTHASGYASMATGDSSTASGNSSKAMGYQSTASGFNDVAMGGGTANSDNSIAIGYGAIANNPWTLAMGFEAQASGFGSIAIGAGGTGSWAIGASATAIGWGEAFGFLSIAVGGAANADNSIAVGGGALGINSVGIGPLGDAFGNNSIAINGNAVGNSSISIGTTETFNDSAIAIGNISIAWSKFSTTIGYNNYAIGYSSMTIGDSLTANGDYSIILGHQSSASGNNSIAVGSNISANGNYSTAIGNNVNAADTGSFVIGDASNTFFGGGTSSIASNQMTMRFSGGYQLFTDTFATVGVTLAPGGNSWATISDRRKKENFEPVNGEGLLQKISGFNLTSWNYKGQNPAQYRHYGPMAQDFYTAFGRDKYGAIGNDTTINQADMEGISFIMIQALERRTREQDERIKKLEAENAQLKNNNAFQGKQIAELTEKDKATNKRLEVIEEMIQKGKVAGK